MKDEFSHHKALKLAADIQRAREHPRTNADKIRNMTDEELATFLYATADNLHTVKCSMQDILEWLESDAQC